MEIQYSSLHFNVMQQIAPLDFAAHETRQLSSFETAIGCF